MVFSFFFLLLFFLSVAVLFWQWDRLESRLYAWFLGLPCPDYDVKMKSDIDVIMADGIRLRGDLYLPHPSGKYPTIIMRTPYNKTSRRHRYPQFGKVFASQGYAVFIQDVRGKFSSEGEFYPFRNEESDGAATIAWVNGQEWCNGKVALSGFSYLGACAWLAAMEGHPCVKTLIPMFSSQNNYSAWINRGVPHLMDMIFWLSQYQGAKTETISIQKVAEIARHLPLNQLDTKLAKRLDVYNEWLSHLQPDDYWEAISVSHRREKIDLPVLFIGGWYDKFIDDTLEDFLFTRKASPQSLAFKSRLVVGPWAHHPTKKLKELSFGAQAEFKHQLKLLLHWLDVWLKEVPSTFDDQYPIEYFMMGKNEWRKTSNWPPPKAVPFKFFLESSGKANSRHGEGKLVFPQPSEEGFDAYIYDPANPVPSIGNKMLYGNEWEGPKEQSDITKREDVLIYLSEPLEKPLEIAGATFVILHVASSAPDTDFFVKICDVFPDGKAYYLQSGFVRMRYHSSLGESKQMEAGAIYRIYIHLGSIAYTFLPSHRLQLQVTSSDFPSHGRNLNTGGDNESGVRMVKADQRVYHGGEYDSHILFFGKNKGE